MLLTLITNYRWYIEKWNKENCLDLLWIKAGVMNGLSSLRVIINPWVNGSFHYCIVWSSYMSFAANTIVAKLTNQFQWNRLVTPSTDRHVSLNSLKSKSQMATRVLFGSTLTQTIALTDTPGFKPFTIMYYWGQTIKTGFHKQWSRSRNRSWSCVKRAYDLMKIENQKLEVQTES